MCVANSYLTIAEYRDAPTSMSTLNLIAGGNMAAQDAELANVIARASAWIDTVCNQPLVAATYTENVVARSDRYGRLSIHPRRAPLNKLISVAVGTHGGNLVAVPDLSGVYVDQEQWVIPTVSTGMYASGGMSGSQVLARITAVSGWANTTTVSATSIGVSTITVADTSGFTPAVGSDPSSATVTIYDGASTETVTVTAATTTTITLASPTLFAHAARVAVSALPADLKWAAILATSAHIRSRGNEAIVASISVQPGATVGTDGQAGRDFWSARKILVPQYSRTR